MKHVLATVQELFSFLWKEKMWWLVPMILIILLFVVIIVFGNTTGLGPFIYTLF